MVNWLFYKKTEDDNENDALEFESLKAPASASPAGA